MHDQKTDFLSIGTPVDVVTIKNSHFRNNRINFHGNKAMPDYLETKIELTGCVFNYPGNLELMANSITNKVVTLETSASVFSDKFSAKITSDGGKITVQSDLPGLKM